MAVGEVKVIRELEGGAIFTIVIDDEEFKFMGNLYSENNDWTDWQYGTCPICGKVSGRTSIGRADFCFCLDHMIAWGAGSNCWGDYKEPWYTDETEEKNSEFLNCNFKSVKEFKAEEDSPAPETGKTSAKPMTYIFKSSVKRTRRKREMSNAAEHKPMTADDILDMLSR